MCIEHNASTHYTHHKQNVYCYVLHSGLAKLRRKKCNLGEIVCLNQWFFVCFVLSNEENFKKNYLYVICTTIFRILEHFVYVLLSQDQKNQNFLFEISWKYSWKRQDQRWILFIFCLCLRFENGITKYGKKWRKPLFNYLNQGGKGSLEGKKSHKFWLENLL